MGMLFIVIIVIGITWYATDLIRRGRELNKMVIAFCKIDLTLNELTPKVELSDDPGQFKEEILVLAYLFRREIIFRLDQYKWSMNTPLLFPGVSEKRIPLYIMFKETIDRLVFLASDLGEDDIIQEVLDGKEAYFELDRAFPNYIKNRI